MINSKLLQDAIEESGMKRNALANKLGLSSYGLALKINNQNEFKASEIAALSEILNLSRSKRDAIFFNPVVE